MTFKIRDKVRLKEASRKECYDYGIPVQEFDRLQKIGKFTISNVSGKNLCIEESSFYFPITSIERLNEWDN